MTRRAVERIVVKTQIAVQYSPRGRPESRGNARGVRAESLSNELGQEGPIRPTFSHMVDGIDISQIAPKPANNLIVAAVLGSTKPSEYNQADWTRRDAREFVLEAKRTSADTKS